MAINLEGEKHLLNFTVYTAVDRRMEYLSARLKMSHIPVIQFIMLSPLQLVWCVMASQQLGWNVWRERSG